MNELNSVSEKNRQQFDRSDLMAVLAVIISIGALVVSLYQTKILRNQQQIMQDQQKASVWPYLEANYKYEYNVIENYWDVDLKYSIENKGVGPAKINDTNLEVLGKSIENYNQLTQEINQFLKDSFDIKEDVNVQINYGIPLGVLSKDETFQILQIKIPGIKKGASVAKKLKVIFSVCFCSIYKDCWTLQSSTKELDDGCDQINGKDN